jgi:DNA polymerase III epsilon subunit-like protein
MKILFFDTETTGLPKDWKASYSEVDNWPRIISLAWLLCDENGNTITQSYELVYPDGWEMPTEKFWVDNGYSQEQSVINGVPVATLIGEFMNAKSEADCIAAHNLNFDHHVMWAEIIRSGKTPRSGMHKICTMLKSTNVCQIPQVRGRGFKWPTLDELYRHLFGKSFENAHDALADVIACKECFFELLRRGVIALPVAEITE